MTYQSPQLVDVRLDKSKGFSQNSQNNIKVSTSEVINIKSGVIDVDTSRGNIALFLPSPLKLPGVSGTLEIKKISQDCNNISLVSQDTKVDGDDLYVFGFNKGDKTVLSPVYGGNWKIVSSVAN